MSKKRNYTDKEKLQINGRHVELFNKSLNGIEFILDGVLADLRLYEDSYLDLPKTVISAFDFIISSLTKIQKGQRLALGLDNEVLSEDVEPQVSVIEGVDFTKV